MSTAGRLSRRYRIAGALFAEFTYDPRRLQSLFVEWEPERPDELRGAARRRYENARADFAALVQRQMGRQLVILESFDMPEELVRELQLAFSPAGGSA